ncbi:oligopeptide transport system substrate-binding protein [Alteromonadaceae bacterium Bs31]|nr:oligopeptide transport system substrate-binding protein [Alteromonadaceae bacterium Bs31]
MKQLFTVVFLCATLSISPGCSKNKQTNVEYGNENGILFLANGTEPQGLDPHLTTGVPESNIVESLMEGLTSLHHDSVEPRPAAAENWTVSKDGKRYIFNLRKDGKWSNGDPLTASDFVYSWKRALSPRLGNHYAYMLYHLENAEAYHKQEIQDFTQVGVKALNDFQLEVKLNNPTFFFLQLLSHHSFYPVHPATIEANGGMDNLLSKWTLPASYVGNGPFVLKTWEVNKEISVAKNAQYWDAANVQLNGIHFFPIEGEAAEERAFRGGQVHSTYTMPIEKIATYKEKHADLLKIYPIYGTYFYLFNTTKPPFNDKNVRKAIALAIDRDRIVSRVTKSEEIPSHSLAPPNPDGYIPEQLFEYNLEKAQQYLADAGYPNGEGFPSFEILFNTHDGHRKIAIAVQQMLKQNLNIDVTLLNQEWKVFITTTNNLEYDVARMGWIGDVADATNFFELMITGVGNNRTGWSNEEYDQLMQQVTRTNDRTEREAIFAKLNALLADEMPIAPFYTYTQKIAIQPNVKNWHSNVLIRPDYKSVFLEHVE